MTSETPAQAPDPSLEAATATFAGAPPGRLPAGIGQEDADGAGAGDGHLSRARAGLAPTARADLEAFKRKVDAGASIAVVPLTIPLLTGPATISTMVIYAEKTRHLWQLGVLVVYGVVIGLVTYAVFTASGRIAKVLGRTGINIMTRLMGLILAAMAVELLADGLVKLFPVLASHVAR